MTDETVKYTVTDGVAELRFNRPEKLNALNFALLDTLARRVLEAGTDGNVRCVLLTGAGRAFSAGGDVKQMLSGSDIEGVRTPQAAALVGAGKLHESIVGLSRMAKPVICAVNGTTAGAGVGLALAGDIIWAARSATFKLAYTAIGLSPDGGTTYALTRAVGPKLATELFLTNRSVDADEALRIGLVSRVLDDDTLLEQARELAATLAKGPTRAFAQAKALVRQSLQTPLETQLENERYGVASTIGSADFMEGVMAFMQKREPKFKGQ